MADVLNLERLRGETAIVHRLAKMTQDKAFGVPAQAGQGDLPMGPISIGDTYNQSAAADPPTGLGKLGTAAVLAGSMLFGGAGLGVGAASLVGLLGGGKQPPPAPVVEQKPAETKPFEDTSFDLRLAR